MLNLNRMSNIIRFTLTNIFFIPLKVMLVLKIKSIWYLKYQVLIMQKIKIIIK